MSARFAAIGLVVADMGRSLAFYRELGLEISPDTDDAPHVDVPLPDGSRLMLDKIETIHSFDPGWTAPTGSHRVGLAFECDDPGDVDAVFAKLVGAGYAAHLQPWDAFWGQRYASVFDPDGNSVELFAALPTDQIHNS
jgi:catechol 2,3-dioxygenase-like lactoylglutathione lyase family enzyme